jgi:competence protein ComEA
MHPDRLQIRARRDRAILAWSLAISLAATALPAFSQRKTDAENPEGKWEVLEGCRLMTNTIVDGDSFQVIHKGRQYAFRLYFVDAPESDPALRDRVEDQAAYFGISRDDVPKAGQLAARFTRGKLEGREFTVMTRWQNALGRSSLARFYCRVLVNGKDLGDELVSAGLARIYGLRANPPDGTRSTTIINQLKHLELTAREQRRGVWDQTQFVPASTEPARTATRGKPAAKIAPDSPLDLNTATYEDLQRLPGIGSVLAKRIIAHRPYKRVEDLTKVPGIGKKTLERLEPLLRVVASAP